MSFKLDKRSTGSRDMVQRPQAHRRGRAALGFREVTARDMAWPPHAKWHGQAISLAFATYFSS